MSAAVLSPDGVYRYLLEREIEQPSLLAQQRGTVNWIMLNPSTADAESDDPTIRKVLAFSARWGFARVVVTNLFALRATDPTALQDHPDPVGPANDAAIREAAAAAELHLAAWGSGPGPRFDAVLRERAHAVARNLAHELHCLELTGGGYPRHPLYLPGRLAPRPFAP